MLTICTDAGHGQKWNNAEAQGYLEKDIVLSVAKKIDKCFRYSGFESVLTREEDKHFSENLTEDLQYRAAIANACRADAFISLHCNGFDDPRVHGFEIWTTPGITKADSLADNIYKQVESDFPSMHMRSDTTDGDFDKESPFHVLKATTMPAVLIELCFLTNPDDLAFIIDETNQQKIAESIVRGTIRSMGV